jgi:hypothetical protein
MERSWLIQRLVPGVKMPNPFSFGGGLVNGGLSSEAVKKIIPIFWFDYMGSAEFESGSVPKTFQKMQDQVEEYESGTVKIDLSKVVIPPWWPHKAEHNTSGTQNVDYFCHKDHVSEVKERIEYWACKESKHGVSKFPTKQDVSLDRTIAGGNSEKPNDRYRIVGWLELNNGFLFSVDQHVFGSLVAMFRKKEVSKWHSQ